MGSKRVDFFIVGAMRSGTSSIRDALTRNPTINVAHGEPKFFSDELRVSSGYEAYHELFDWDNNYVLRGEKSPQYSVSLTAPKRIQEYNPDARIIWMFRDPVARAISHYAHSRYRTEKAIPLQEAIEKREELERVRSTMAYVYRSEYQKHITHWLSFFPREQHFIIILENLLDHPAVEMQRLHDYLGVSIAQTEFPHVYNARVKKISEDIDLGNVKAVLTELLKPTVIWMEDFLGQRLPEWRTS